MTKRIALLLLLGACNRSTPETTSVATPTPAPAPAAAPAPAPAPAAAGKFGAPLSDKATLPVSVVIAAPQNHDDQDIKIEGQVGGVCQKKGCWMTIGSGEPGKPTVRVTFKDYGFFVPKESLGKHAVVEGRFKVTTLSQPEAQHYADDEAKAGAARRVVRGPERTLMLVATGVEIR